MGMHSTLAATDRSGYDAIRHQEHMHGTGTLDEAGEPRDSKDLAAIQARAMKLGDDADRIAIDIVQLTYMIRERDEKLAHFARRCLAAEKELIELRAKHSGRPSLDAAPLHDAISTMQTGGVR